MVMTHALLSNAHGIPLAYANRHGLITGPTGTGKTVSLMRLADEFARQGVPVFIADAKGDMAHMGVPLDPFRNVSITFDHMGVDIAARALDLTDTQAACLEIAYAVAAGNRLPLRTIGDLRQIIVAMMRDSRIAAPYGHVTPTSLAIVMRALTRLETQGGNQFFRAPCFDVARLLDGTHVLKADSLIKSPRVYAAFLLFLLDQLYSRLPEIGDTDKPRLVLFFDESHLLFQDASPHLIRKIEQTVRLIRSKGVGVYFVSQAPEDVPQVIRNQLAHTVTHARALGVGVALLQSMGDKPVTVRVVMPDMRPCASELVADSSATPVSETGIPATGWSRMGWPEALLLVAVLAAGGLGVAAVYLWAGKLGLGVAGILGVGLLKAR